MVGDCPFENIIKKKSERRVQNTKRVEVQGLYMWKINQNTRELERSKTKTTRSEKWLTEAQVG